MSESPVTVTSSELRDALVVWIRTAPKRMWRDYWAHSETVGKWSSARDSSNRFDPQIAMAEHLVSKFEQAGWSAVRPEPEMPFNHAERPAASEEA